RLTKLASPQFDPRAVAYVETPVVLHEQGAGRANIVSETPTEVNISLAMDTPGLIVLADRWDEGWRAHLDLTPVSILRTDHALRGVVVPQGTGTLRFTYQPSSFRIGLLLFAVALATLAGWWLLQLRRRRLSVRVVP
ncbi:MAG TPA: hypothetical protein VIM14_03745, partial [Polyangia bacterium]